MVVLSACGGRDKDDFQKGKGGMKYKFISTDESARKAQPNDILTVKLYFTNDKDSVLFDTKDFNEGIIQIQLSQPKYEGDIFDVLSMTHEGDSLIYKTSADSFFNIMNNQPLPDFVAKGSDLTFYIKVLKIQSQEELMQQMQQEAEMKAKEEEERIKEYLAQNNLNVQPTESGLYYIEVKKGKGKKAEPGKTVKVHYKGTLLDGTPFDSSYDRGEPIEFVLGQGMVIPGWEEGIAMMNEGGKAKLIIPSKLAYGPNQRGNVIKPYSTLVFEVELIEVK
jgi:FKBP-type peptidyl-prolyl cis-trans isomerase